MNYRKVILIMISIVLLVIVTIITLLLKNSKNVNNDVNKSIIQNNVNSNNDLTNQIANEKFAHFSNNADELKINILHEVESKSDYFTLKDINEKYFTYLEYKNKEAITKILSPKYILEYKITDENISNLFSLPKLTSDKQYYVTTIKKILKAQLKSNLNIYIVTSNLRVSGSNTSVDNKIIVEIDVNNNTYNVYPYQYLKDKGYDKLENNDSINFSSETIEDREYNKLEYITATDKELVNEYFGQLREFLLYNQEYVYNILDNSYRQKKFISKENLYKYLSENYKQIFLMKINKYKIVKNENYTDYICTDNYNNYYIFRKNNGITDYTVFLDNYTIMLQEDIERYNKLDEYEKAKQQLVNFIKKVNTKDYQAIYTNLDDTFKKSNFQTMDKLKEFIKNNFYTMNTVEITENDDSVKEYSVFNCKITNMENKNESKNITVIIDIKENTDYTMSFSFN